MKHLALLFLIYALALHAQSDDTSRSWNQPREPFRIIGNVYYVGASEIASYLITTPGGHFLLDGGFAETAPMILANIHKLGFNPKDVKVLLNSQAHFDHAAGLAELKRQTGARMIASKEDGEVLQRGGKKDFYFDDKMLFPPVAIDQFLKDREPVKLGGVLMTPVLTPGHTKGCTTWTTTVKDREYKYSVVFLCGLTILPDTDFIHNKAYPNIATDFASTYEKLKKLPCDVFLGAHGSYFHLEEKAKELKTRSGLNPFVRPGELATYVQEKEQEFLALRH